MKNLIVALALLLSTAPVFAQRYGSCRVIMVDRMNRILQTYYAQSDYRTGMCRDGLRQCNFDIQRRNVFGARCVQLR